MSLIPAFEIGLWNAWIFMIWPWVDMLVVRFVGVDVYQRASGQPEMKTSRQYRVVSYVSMVIDTMAVAYSIFLPLKLGTGWFYAGLAIFLAGLVVLATATVNFATTAMDVPVTRGIYHYSRHPLYLASLLIYLSVGIASSSWVFLLVFVMQSFSIRISAVEEEHFCLENYGEAYLEYIGKTPRWLGLPKSKKSDQQAI
jgi:protein-S-isoprenylcysteine O-methyltransferase Ste14